MPSKRRDPYGSDSSDSDYEPWQQETKTRRKVRKTRRRKAPSLVTPEQIVANAAAARQSGGTEDDLEHHHRQRQGERSSHKRASAHSAVAAAYDTKTSVKTELKREEMAKTKVASVQALARSGSDDDDDEADADAQSSDEQDANDDTGASADGSGDDSAEQDAVPAVFQCGTCRSIFGDTHALVGGNAELSLLSLSAVTNISASAAPQTSRTGIDAGSSYHELLCSECQSVLGRQYVTTPVALDALRGLFSFETAVIATYQFGYAQLQRRIAAGESPDAKDTGSSSSGLQSAGIRAMTRATRACEAAAKALARDRTELLQLRADMTNVQNVLLVVNERLQQLEEPDDDEMEDEGAVMQGRES